MNIIAGSITIIGSDVPDGVSRMFPEHKAVRRYFPDTDESLTFIDIPDTIIKGDSYEAERKLSGLLVSLNSVTTFGCITFYSSGFYTRYRWERADDIPQGIVPDGMQLIRGRWCELINRGEWEACDVLD